MQAQNGKNNIKGTPTSRLAELGISLLDPPTPLGVYVESTEAGELLFLSGILPVVDGKLAISGRLGESLSVDRGRQATRIAALNALAVAQEHLGSLNRIAKLIKLTVLMTTTEGFVDHATVADGASKLFAHVFGKTPGHVRLVYGAYSLPIGTPVIVDVIFEIKPARRSISKQRLSR